MNPSESDDIPIDQLTKRQLQILKLIATGNSVKDVAKLLQLAPKSVEGHKYRIMQKLGLHDRVLLARYAIRNGLVTA